MPMPTHELRDRLMPLTHAVLTAALMWAPTALIAAQNPPQDAVDTESQQADEEADQQQQQQPRVEETEFSFYERVALIDETFPYDESAPAVGHWHGNVKTSFGEPAAAVLIEQNEDGSYAVHTSITPGGLPHRTGEMVAADGRAVRFRAPLDPAEAGVLEFLGEISEDGQRMTGQVAMPREMLQQNLRIERLLRQQNGEPELTDAQALELLQEWSQATFELARTPRPLDLEPRTAYGGKVELAEDIFFDIVLCFAETPGGNWVGHIDIPQQYVGGWMLDQVHREGETFEAHMGGGSPAIITGTVSDDGERFTGLWKYRNLPVEIPIEFARIDGYDKPDVPEMPTRSSGPTPNGAAPSSSRPQYPEEPYPYTVRDVQIQAGEIIVLDGTLTIPAGDGPFPAAILLSDVGPHDRDSNMFGHKWFMVLADHLSRNGIAVLRYDDRGVGKSIGRFREATMHDFADDATAAYAFLRAIESIDPARIGFIGHGEGASVAAMAAANSPDLAFAAMLGPAGTPGWRAQLDQTVHTFAQRPDLDEALINALIDSQRGLFDAFVNGESQETQTERAVKVAEAEAAIAEALGGSASLPAEHRARMLLAQMNQPPMAASLRYDPAEDLARVSCPVFVAWGSLDRIASPGLHQPEVAQARDHDADQFAVYDGLNHLFQPAQSGFPNEYGRIATTIDEQLLDDLVTFIRATVGE